MNVYFSGIGGVGIGPLAEIARDGGYTVCGSDASDSPITDRLRARGDIELTITSEADFLRQQHEANPIDWFVHTSALPDSHPELVYARSQGIRCTKRDAFLAEFIRNKQLTLIAVAGTHGKTTTAGMCVWALQQLGVPVSYSVGSTLSFGPSGQFNPKSSLFVYECDEYDRNFLAFSPEVTIITSLDYDHPDTYPTQADYNAAFAQFIGQSTTLVTWQPIANALDAMPSSATILAGDAVRELHIAGLHNRQNATLAIEALSPYVPNPSALPEALERFPGTGRRFEKLADNLYSDYGHHPVEIAATLELARELSSRVTLVYQPHQNIRQHQIKAGYPHAFSGADTVYWLPTYLTREDPALPVLGMNELIEGTPTPDKFHAADMNDELWQEIGRARAAGNLVVCMGAGTIDDWVRTQLRATDWSE